MFAASFVSPSRRDTRPLLMAAIAGLACAFAIGKTLPTMIGAVSTAIEPLCATAEPTGSKLDVVEPIGSYALPNVPGKRVTIVRVFYGPGGFTRPHKHAGSVTAYYHQGRNPLAARRRSGRDLQGRAVVLRAAGLDAHRLGQCQRHRARGIDRGVRRR